MTWAFDQAPNVGCIASASIFTGRPVLIVVHYEDDHSWAFLDGDAFDPASAKVVQMSTVLDQHPELREIADLPPGWSASRMGVDGPWSKERDE